LKPTEGSKGGSGFGGGRLNIHESSIGRLVELLSAHLDRPVVDRTGIAGNYTAKLTWTPDTAASAAPGADAPSGPSLFAALQEQFGMKLEPAKALLKAYVIERAERPKAN